MPSTTAETTSPWLFGSTTPYAEPPWAQGCPSPYYTDSHRRLRSALRKWVDEHLTPFNQEWEEAGHYPRQVYEQACRDGLIMPCAAGAHIPDEWAGKFPIIGGVDAKEWDGFHDVILHDEIARVGGVGLQNGLFGGNVTLPMPAVQRFGGEELRKRIANDVLGGKKRLCLAITEPDAGSDVRGIQTEAEPAIDGRKGFVVNGQKKWITAGMYADYFLTLVRDVEIDAMTLLVIERREGLTTKHMKTSGSGAAGTAFVDFDDVFVPAENVVGKRGEGFKYIMANFNHERLFIGVQALSCARICLQDSIEYAQSRETFGKKLVEQPVIRQKIAHMSRETEAAWAWMESLVYQLKNLPREEAEFLLAGTTGQFKAHAALILEHVVREAVQIMGGIGLTRGGRGARVEQVWRDVKAIVIPGGSEEILFDLASRRALKIQERRKKSPRL